MRQKKQSKTDSGKSRSYCVGPHFEARPTTQEAFEYSIHCRGIDCGTVIKTDTGNWLPCDNKGNVVGTPKHSIRQAGIAVLRAAGVKGDLETTEVAA